MAARTRSSRPDFGEADKAVIINLQQEQILLLKEKNKRLQSRLDQLEGRLKKDSSNSSKPPSSDMNKPKRTTSSRKKSGKKPGGQPGHKGKTLKPKRNPDEVISLAIDACNNCNKSLVNVSAEITTRQEFEIPEPKMLIIEYQAESKLCSCGCTTSAAFPKHITHKTQYGFRAKSLMSYITQEQFIPYKRASEFFNTIYGHKVSVGTLVNTNNLLDKRSEQVELEIKELLSREEYINCDETSMKVNGDKKWLHTVGTKSLTHYALHEKRGSQATMDIGILPNSDATIIHDHWKSYFQYSENTHSLCNAHHLRELRFLNEHHKLKWAKKLSDFLLKVKQKKEKHQSVNKSCFSRYFIKKYSDEYDKILVNAQKEQAKRGTKDSHNLLKRLLNFKFEVLHFMYDFNVPFTNNLSERDLRMNKVKQKVSGCFRNPKSGDSYCRIRSLISTAKKNGKNVYNIIKRVFTYNITTKSILAT